MRQQRPLERSQTRHVALIYEGALIYQDEARVLALLEYSDMLEELAAALIYSRPHIMKKLKAAYTQGPVY